jgi:hypothetical protein
MNTLYFVAVNSLSVCIVAGIGVLKRYIVIGINFAINNKIIGTIQSWRVRVIIKIFLPRGNFKTNIIAKEGEN